MTDCFSTSSNLPMRARLSSRFTHIFGNFNDTQLHSSSGYYEFTTTIGESLLPESEQTPTFCCYTAEVYNFLLLNQICPKPKQLFTSVSTTPINEPYNVNSSSPTTIYHLLDTPHSQSARQLTSLSSCKVTTPHETLTNDATAPAPDPTATTRILAEGQRQAPAAPRYFLLPTTTKRFFVLPSPLWDGDAAAHGR